MPLTETRHLKRKIHFFLGRGPFSGGPRSRTPTKPSGCASESPRISAGFMRAVEWSNLMLRARSGNAGYWKSRGDRKLKWDQAQNRNGNTWSYVEEEHTIQRQEHVHRINNGDKNWCSLQKMAKENPRDHKVLELYSDRTDEDGHNIVMTWDDLEDIADDLSVRRC